MKERTDSQSPEGLLTRWSRRKQEAQVAVESHDVAEIAGADSAPIQPVDSEVETHPTDADMPSLDSLDASSDFSGFMSPKVSEQLRRLALRKLFHAAAFNTADGLDDYAEDFTSFEKLGDLITADMRFEQAVEEERRLEKERIAEMAQNEQEKESELAQATADGEEGDQAGQIMEDSNEGLAEETLGDEFNDNASGV